MIRGVLRSVAGLTIVAATTWFAFEEVHANALIAGFAYVLIVLIVAASWGLIESLVTSVVAMQKGSTAYFDMGGYRTLDCCFYCSRVSRLKGRYPSRRDSLTVEMIQKP
jgi:hypothetical protein